MTATEYINHKGTNVFGLLWTYVNTNPITLMEQLKMFNQCSIKIKGDWK